MLYFVEVMTELFEQKDDWCVLNGEDMCLFGDGG